MTGLVGQEEVDLALRAVVEALAVSNDARLMIDWFGWQII